MPSKDINISVEKIKRLFDSYGINEFKCAVNRLITLKMLSKDEISFLGVLIQNIKNQSFFNKSYIIYLSNGIIDDYGETNDLKKQLLFELGIISLQKKIIKRFSYCNEDLNLYSLTLNQMIGCHFDSIEKEKEHYLFLKEDKIVLKIKKNEKLKIIKGVNFLMHNKNPYHINNDHPDVKFVEWSLGDISLKKWIRQFKNAYGLIKKYSFDVYGEITYLLDTIVPIGYEPERQNSSSYSRGEGILYFSYTDSDMKQAEAIIHEVHHTIFNIINQCYPFLRNDSELKYYSSYRPDARPLNGCFLGLHAFVAVQNFYSKVVRHEVQNEDLTIRFMDSYIKNRKMIDIIQKYAQFSKMGGLFFEDIKIKFNVDVDYFKIISKKYPTLLRKTTKNIDVHFITAKNENDILLF